jgi:NAD(P)-dependent dehydrogenase (short-subunit alcohol dehydrogenase family)
MVRRPTSTAGRTRHSTFDLGTAEEVAALVRQLPELDILVNNVGIFEPKPFDHILDEDWLRFFQADSTGLRRNTR